MGFLFGFVFVNLLLKKFGFALWGFYSHVTFFFVFPLNLRSTTSKSHKLARLTIWLRAEVLNPNTGENYLDWAIGMKFCVNSFGFSHCVEWDTFSFVTGSTQYRFTFRISFACKKKNESSIKSTFHLFWTLANCFSFSFYILVEFSLGVYFKVTGYHPDQLILKR